MALYSNTTGSNTTGSNNTAIGNEADFLSGTLSNATAIGNGAIVSSDNTIQLGNTDVTAITTTGTFVTTTDVWVGRNLIQNSENLAIASGLGPYTLSGNSNIYELTGTPGSDEGVNAPTTFTGQVVYVYNGTDYQQTISGQPVGINQTATLVYFPTSGWRVTGVY